MQSINIDEQIKDELELVIHGNKYVVRDIPVDAFLNGLELADKVAINPEIKPSVEDYRRLYSEMKTQIALFLSISADDKLIQEMGIVTCQKVLKEITQWLTHANEG